MCHVASPVISRPVCWTPNIEVEGHVLDVSADEMPRIPEFLFSGSCDHSTRSRNPKRETRPSRRENGISFQFS